MLLAKAEVESLARIAVALGEDPAASIPAIKILHAIEARLASEVDDSAEVKRLQLRIHLLQQEVDGLRETLEGLERAIIGGGKSYRAARQSVDLLEKDLDDARREASRNYAIAVGRIQTLSTDVERLQLERLQATSGMTK